VQGEGLDSAIWRPIRMLQERGALLRRLAARAEAQGRDRSARFFQDEADEALRRAVEMRRTLGDDQHRDEPEPIGAPVAADRASSESSVTAER
jgi:hypothetical protein